MGHWTEGSTENRWDVKALEKYSGFSMLSSIILMSLIERIPDVECTMSKPN